MIAFRQYQGHINFVIDCSLIKMLYWICEKSGGEPLTWPQMQYAILRNFGGVKSDDWDPLYEFKKRLNLPTKELIREDYDEKV